MNYISTTDLRTKSAKLRDSLKKGESIFLLHRSKVIGVFEPYIEDIKIATPEKLKKISSLFSTGRKYSYKKRRDLYLKHIEEKYGKSLS